MKQEETERNRKKQEVTGRNRKAHEESGKYGKKQKETGRDIKIGKKWDDSGRNGMIREEMAYYSIFQPIPTQFQSILVYSSLFKPIQI